MEKIKAELTRTEQSLREKELLLEISQEIANIKAKRQLNQLIKEKISSVFSFFHCTICVLREDNISYKAFVLDPNSKVRIHEKYRSLVTEYYALENGIDDAIIHSEEPLIFDFAKLSKEGKLPVQGQIIYETGVMEMIAVRLVNEMIPYGAIYFYSDKANHFSKSDFQIVSSIARIISPAIINIISAEAIEQKEQEQDILLSISDGIARIKHRSDLLLVINNQLRQLFSFSHSLVLKINQDQTSLIKFLIDPNSKSRNHPEYEKIINNPIDREGIPDTILGSNEPVIIDLEKIAVEENAKDYVQMYIQTGIKELLGVALRKPDQTPLGTLTLMSDTKGHFGKNEIKQIKGIAYHIATAVDNILANEELAEKEAEQSQLLSFSYDISKAKNRVELSTIVKFHLRNLFHIKEYIITIRSEDTDSYSYFLHDLSVKEPDDEGFRIITSPKMPKRGAMTGVVLENENPVTFDISELLEKKELTFPSASFWKAAGAKQIMGKKLKAGNDDIGIIWIQPGQISERLLNAITAQLAVSISNILAYEKIQEQLQEINNYKQKLEDENNYLQGEMKVGNTYTDIIGNGNEMQKIFQSLLQVSSSDSTVLILGETGTGKELVARAIHNASPRRDKLLVKVNCASLPVNLIESELFGHERGSFTGATERRIGKFELANHGTLFLDEIGEMPLDLQAKLLRAVQEKEIERIGGKTTLSVDVRIIAATNRDLQKEVAEGRFRLDLFYRLNVFPITLPPLRERKEDIPLLATHFMNKFAKRIGKPVKNITKNAIKQLTAYPWPGNVRELEHLMERSILLTSGSTLKEVYLAAQPFNTESQKKETQNKSLEETERDYIIAVLNRCNGKVYGIGGAAEILKMNVSTLNSKIRKLGIVKERTFNKNL